MLAHARFRAPNHSLQVIIKIIVQTIRRPEKSLDNLPTIFIDPV